MNTILYLQENYILLISRLLSMINNTCPVNVFEIMSLKENETARLVASHTNSSHSLHSDQDILFSQYCRSNQSKGIKTIRGNLKTIPSDGKVSPIPRKVMFFLSVKKQIHVDLKTY